MDWRIPVRDGLEGVDDKFEHTSRAEGVDELIEDVCMYITQKHAL